jgi:hypothetical protein
MQFRLPHIALLFGLAAVAQADPPITELEFSPNAINLTADFESFADKARLLRLTDGTLFVAWQQELGPPAGAWGPDGVRFMPRDILARMSADGGISWTATINLSNTAALTDAGAFYDATGDGTGLSLFYGDSGKPSVISAGNDVAVAWSDAYCGAGEHGPARYATEIGEIEVPYRCLYVARLKVTTDGITIVAVDRVTDAARDVMNEVIRATGSGFAAAWQEDPAGLQLGEARGGGHGLSGARVTPGTDIWYSWIPRTEFSNPLNKWRNPVAISNNFDYANQASLEGGASRPSLFLAGSPAHAILAYEEAKNAGPTDVGKFVRFHEFPFSDPPGTEAGTLISNPTENARRARIIATSSPGKMFGTRMVVMWRQGEGIQGAPADFMMRVGAVPPGTDLVAVPNAGFRGEDLWPAVNATDPQSNETPLNISGARLDDASSIHPDVNTMAHRAVMDGDFIYAGFTQDPAWSDGADQYRYYLRWSDDGGRTWSDRAGLTAGAGETGYMIEPRLVRTPGSVNSGKPEDIRNPGTFLLAWGTEQIPDGQLEPVRDALYVTRTMDRGMTYEAAQELAATRTSDGQSDEQIQLRVTPDGQHVTAVWIRKEPGRSDVMFGSAVGITRTADLSVSMSATEATPDVGFPSVVTVTVANRGPQSATGLNLRIDVPAGLSVIETRSASGICEFAADLHCDLDDLDAGTSAVVTLTVVADRRGLQTLIAEASALEDEPAPLDNRAELGIEAIAKADIAVAASLDKTQMSVGEDFTLQFQVDNSGPQLASAISVSIGLPTNVVVLETSGCSLGTNVIECAAPDLLRGESWEHRVQFRAGRAAFESMSIIADASEADPVAADNATSVTFRIVGSAPSAAGGGCVYAPGDTGDDTLWVVLVLLLAWQVRKRLRYGY